MLENFLNPLNQIALSFIGSYLFFYRKKLYLNITSLKQWLKSDNFKNGAKYFYKATQWILVISVVGFAFSQTIASTLSGTISLTEGVPLEYVLVVKGLSILCSIAGSFLVIRSVYIGKDSIFK